MKYIVIIINLILVIGLAIFVINCRQTTQDIGSETKPETSTEISTETTSTTITISEPNDEEAPILLDLYDENGIEKFH